MIVSFTVPTYFMWGIRTCSHENCTPQNVKYAPMMCVESKEKVFVHVYNSPIFSETYDIFSLIFEMICLDKLNTSQKYRFEKSVHKLGALSLRIITPILIYQENQ